MVQTSEVFGDIGGLARHFCGIPALLGHTNIRASMRYTEVSKVKLAGVRSPLDDFPPPDELDEGEEAGKCREKGDSAHAHYHYKNEC